jgi:hypothetical protein
MDPEVSRRDESKHYVACPAPVSRRLRGYAFDPSLSTRLETALINETVYHVRWEEPSKETAATVSADVQASVATPDGPSGLRPGPIGEYVEVVDYDPASGCVYAPVDLNNQRLIAQDGLAPSTGNPQFHQQFVYAVTMTTIANFEKALGRPALWSSKENQIKGAPNRDSYVRRLRIYPHALREANAYYSPTKKALLFGYFPASSDRPDRNLPGGIVFTCLSHDIIAHETTHALLDGARQRFIEANQPDALAFHEAFADLVALFQRFSFADVLAHQIRRTRGDLTAPNLLGELAQEFGEAVGNYGALRSAIGEFDRATGKWKPHEPDPKDYETTEEPHARGAILVAAIFDAFISVYKARTADLMRIASSGTGVLPEGELHPDLVGRLAAEASKTARQILNACIRALDYCPPVDINFGDYLRALVTADADLVPNDKWGYRVAIIEAFRRRGIYPRDVRTLSTESLLWRTDEMVRVFFQDVVSKLRTMSDQIRYVSDREEYFNLTEKVGEDLNLWIKAEGHHALNKLGRATGMTFKWTAEDGTPIEGLRGDPKKDVVPKFQVHTVRPVRRVGPDGNTLNQLIVSMIQTRDVPLDPTPAPPGVERDKFKFRGGCTLILDLDTKELRYLIAKDVTDEKRLERQRAYRLHEIDDGSQRSLYFGRIGSSREPFAMLHSKEDAWGGDNL